MPGVPIQQEYKIKSPGGSTWLWFDFYIPSLSIAIEVQGQQHFAFNSFYHNTDLDFINQKKRDSQKELWCEQNGVTLVKVYYDDEITSELLMNRLEEALKQEIDWD